MILPNLINLILWNTIIGTQRIYIQHILTWSEIQQSENTRPIVQEGDKILWKPLTKSRSETPSKQEVVSLCTNSITHSLFSMPSLPCCNRLNDLFYDVAYYGNRDGVVHQVLFRLRHGPRRSRMLVQLDRKGIQSFDSLLLRSRFSLPVRQYFFFKPIQTWTDVEYYFKNFVQYLQWAGQ